MLPGVLAAGTLQSGAPDSLGGLLVRKEVPRLARLPASSPCSHAHTTPTQMLEELGTVGIALPNECRVIHARHRVGPVRARIRRQLDAHRSRADSLEGGLGGLLGHHAKVE